MAFTRPERFRRRPALERLEERFCPAFTIYYNSAVLEIIGRPTLPYVHPGDGLQLNLGANNLLTVQEVGGAQTHYLGTYRAPANVDVSLALTNRDVTVNLGGYRLPGNLLINLGAGDVAPTSLTGNPVDIIDGEIGGNVTILNGSGAEVVNLGQSGAVNPVRIDGDTTLALNPAPSQSGNTLNINNGSTVLGNVTGSEVENINVGESGSGSALAFVRKNLTLSAALARGNVGVLEVYGEVDGNVQFVGSPARQVSIKDKVDVQPTGLVLGNLFASMGPGGGSFTVDGLVKGNVTENGSTANDFVSVGGTVQGSLTVFLQAGNDSVSFDGTVYGNMSISGANGNDYLNSPVATVYGSMSINLGNGDDTATVNTVIGGKFNWNSGNGNDSLALGGNFYNVHIGFGTGDDTLTLDPSAVLTGLVRDRGGDNTFNQNGATLLPTLVFINFP